MKSAHVDVVLLAYNEVNTIQKEIEAWMTSVVRSHPSSRLIIGEDGSSDGTTELIRALSRDLPIIHLHRSTREGYIPALYRCLSECTAPYVFLADTGNKFDPQDFWKLYEARDTFDVIAAYRSPRNDQAYRQLMTWGYNRLLCWYFHLPNVRDADSGFRLYNRKAVETALSIAPIFSDLITSELTVRMIRKGLRYGELPIRYYSRSGKSRGLPLHSIPQKTLRVLRRFRQLRSMTD